MIEMPLQSAVPKGADPAELKGGWHTAVFFERRWVNFATMTLELTPTHWLPIPGPERGYDYASTT
jgi:hypothetical protein